MGARTAIAVAGLIAVTSPVAAAPGTLVWQLDADGAIVSSFSPTQPCPLTSLSVGHETHLLDDSGQRARIITPPPVDQAARVTSQETPHGRLLIRPEAIALIDTATGEPHWQHSYENPIGQPFGQALDQLPAMAYSFTEHYLVLWRSGLGGMSLTGDSVFVLDIATGQIDKVVLIGNLGRHCVIVPGGFVALMMPDRNTNRRTLACYTTTGKRQWWRTVDDGPLTVVTAQPATGPPRTLLEIMHTVPDSTEASRPLLVDAATGKPLPRPALPPITACTMALSPSGDRLVFAGRTIAPDIGDIVAGAAQTATGELDWWRPLHTPGHQSEPTSRQHKLGAIAIAPTTGVIALIIQWQTRSGNTGADLWLLAGATGEPLARTPIPDLGYHAAVAELTFLPAGDYLLVRHARQAGLFTAH